MHDGVENKGITSHCFAAVHRIEGEQHYMSASDWRVNKVVATRNIFAAVKES